MKNDKCIIITTVILFWLLIAGFNNKPFSTSVECNIEQNVANYSWGDDDLLYIIQAENANIYKEFKKDCDSFIKYLRHKTLESIAAENFTYRPQVILNFSINKNGEPNKIALTQSSGSKKIDKLIVESIKKMPKWKSIIDKNEGKVNSSFKLLIGHDGC